MHFSINTEVVFSFYAKSIICKGSAKQLSGRYLQPVQQASQVHNTLKEKEA